jgi:EmrB/QacA subfamily drug resistance transporter
MQKSLAPDIPPSAPSAGQRRRLMSAHPMDPETVHRRRWWTLAVLNVSLLLIVMDNTILNVALPTLARDLHASGSQLQWMVDSYVLVFAGLLLTAGALGDRFGRRGALSSGLVVFGVGSAAAMVAGSASQLIAARALMGVGGALIMPATLSILTNVFTDPKERAKAIGLWATVGGLAVAIGPVTGGWLLEHFSWSAAFTINLPVVVAALVAGRFVVPTSRDPHTPPLDLPGAVGSIVGLGALVWAIITAGEHGWTATRPLVGFGVAVVTLAGFVAWERHTAHPMLDMAFFANRRFTAASVAVMLGYFALFGSLFLITQLLQAVLGYSAFDAGIRLLPFALTMAVFATASAKLVELVGTKLVVVAGMTLVAGGLLWAASLGDGSTYRDYLPALLVLGTGVALTWAPTTESIMGSLPEAKAGVGSAVNDTVREVGGALGVAVLGSIVASRFASSMHQSTSSLPDPARHAANDSIGSALVVAQQVGGRTGATLAAAAHTAYVDGFGLALMVAAGVALAGALIAAIWLPARATDIDDERTTDTTDAELATGDAIAA